MIGKDKSYYGIGINTSDLQRDADRAKKQFKGIGDTAVSEGQRIDTAFKGLIGGMIGVFGVNELRKIVSDIARVRNEFEQLEISFTTMLGSREKGNALMRQAVDTAARTPFDLSGVATGYKQLLAYGIEVEKVDKSLKMLGDVASGVSAPLNDIVYLYGTLNASGRVALMDIRQFAGRGIPIYEELAKVMGIAKEQVNEFASKGKISFADIEKAFQNMTSAGGKFDNLMEAQSNSIGGMQANLEDAIDMMKNDIGKKLEPSIKGAITSAGNLVENYEEIGRTIGGLVVAYGSYKAVMITLTAIEANRRKVLVMINQMAKVQMALNKSITKSEAVRIVQTELLTKALIKQRIEQLKLNLAVMANPYVIASVAVAGLAFGIYKLITAETAAEKATKAFNDSLNKQKEQTDNLRSEVEKLIGTIKDETATQNQKHSALTTLQALYPSIFKNLDIEIIKNRDLADMIRQVNLELENKNRLQNAEDLERAKKIYSSYNVAVDKMDSDDAKFVRKLLYGDNFWKSFTTSRMQQANELGEWIKTAEKAQTAEFKNSWVANDPKTYYTALADSAEKEKKRLEKLDADFRKNQTGDVKWSPYDIAIQAQNKIIQDSKAELSKLTKETKEETSTARDEIAKWNKELATLKTEREKILNSALSETDRDTKLAELDEREKTLREKLKSRGADFSKGGAPKDYTDQLEQQKISLERANRDIELQAWQARINAMPEGLKKTLEANKLAYEREAEQLKRQAEDRLKQIQEYEKLIWESKGGEGKFTPTTTELSEADKLNFGGQLQDAKSKQTLDDLNAQEEALKRFEELSYQVTSSLENDEVRKQNAIKKTYQEMRKSLDEMLKSGDITKEQYDNLIPQIDSAESKAQLEQLIEGVNDYQTRLDKLNEEWNAKLQYDAEHNSGQLAEVIKKGQAEAIGELNAEFLTKSDDWQMLFGNLESLSVKSLQRLKEKIKEAMKGMNLDPASMKAIMDELDKVDKQISSKNPFAGLAEGIEKYKEASDKESKSDALNLISSNIGSLGQMAESIFGEVVGGLQALGVEMDEETQSLLSNIGGMIGGATQLAQGIMTGNPIDIVKGGIKLLTSAINVFDSSSRKANRTIRANEKELDNLEKAYRKLERTVNESYGSEKAEHIEQMKRMREKQIELTRLNIEAEKSKKKPDKEKIKAWEDEITELEYQIEDLGKSAQDAIFGEDIKSAIDNFANAYADAWAKGNDKAKTAKDIVKNMIKSMIMEAMKADLSKVLPLLRSQLESFWVDGIISPEEEAELQRRAEEIIKGLDDKYSWADRFMKDGESQGSATYGAYEKITQDQADSIDGRLTGIHMEVVRSSSYLSNIDINIMQMNTVMINSWQELTDINKNTKQLYEMNERLGKIEKNTAKL